MKSLFTRSEDGKTFFENGVYVGDILADVDGFYKWFPDAKKGGYLDEGFLFAMGNFLKELNSEWDAEINKYFEENK